jgi:hypothetical protein
MINLSLGSEKKQTLAEILLSSRYLLMSSASACISKHMLKLPQLKIRNGNVKDATEDK